MKDLASSQSSQAPSMNTQPFHDAFGDNTPHIEPTPLGRFRLVQALRGKFGDNFRAHSHAQALLSHFDNEYEFFRRYRKLRGNGGKS